MWVSRAIVAHPAVPSFVQCRGAIQILPEAPGADAQYGALSRNRPDMAGKGAELCFLGHTLLLTT